MPYLTVANDIQSIIAKLSQAKTLWMDTEIAEFKTQSPRLSLIQVLPDYLEVVQNIKQADTLAANTYILDVLDRPELVEDFINQIMVNPRIEKVLHNAGYDIRFLGNDLAQNVTCTLKMARQIPYYVLQLPNFQLKTLIEILCQTPSVDKEEQGSDWGKRPLTEKQLQYATMDAAYLAQVHHRLLEIISKINPEPAIDDLVALEELYQKVESDWKLLDSEIDELKDRIKTAMQAQEITENSYFRLSSSTIMKVDFLTLSVLSQTQDIKLNFPITLTKELQKQLGKLINNPSLGVEEILSWRLMSKGKQRKSSQKSLPEPMAENLTELGERYREILPQWKLLNSEIEHLKERIKQAMIVQDVQETVHFKLSNSSTLKTDFFKLSQLLLSLRIELDFPVTLTKEIQKQLGEALEQIEVKIEYITSRRLIAKAAETEEEDIPF